MLYRWLFGGPNDDFLAAARKGNYEFVHGMLEKQGREHLLKVKDPLDLSIALHLACRNRHLKIFQLLLKGSDVTAVDRVKRTPLHYACMRSDSLEFVRQLLSHGANIEAKDKYAWTPLHVACSKNEVEIVQLLVQRNASLDARNVSGETALHLVSIRGLVDVARILIDFKSDIEAINNEGRSPLHYASMHGQSNAVQLLIQHGAKLNAKDRQNNTPLHLASRHGNFDMVQLLLDKGADIEAKNYAAWTPLHEACKGNHLEVGILLIDRGANVFSETAKGFKCRDLISSAFPIYQAILSAEKTATQATAISIDNGAIHVASDTTHGDFIFPDAVLSLKDEGQYPLHCAIKYGYEEDIIEALEEIDEADKNKEDSEGRTAIDLAALTGQWEMVKFLKENGCNYSSNQNSPCKTFVDSVATVWKSI